jgi:hypothetical protein
VIKINPYGDTLFTRLVGLPGSTTRAAVSDSKGGCVIAGYSGQSFTTCIDKFGNVVWERSYGGFVQIHEIIRTRDGGYIACGSISLQHGYLLKIDSAGSLEWQKVYTSTIDKVLHDIAEVGNEFLAVGYDGQASLDTNKVTLTRIDLNGTIISERHFTVSGRHSVGFKILYDHNDLIVGGSTTDENITREQVFIARIDTAANVLFERIFDSPYSTSFGSLKTASENRYVISFNTLYGRILLPEAIVTDSLGNAIYERTFFRKNRYEVLLYESIVCDNKDIIFVGVALENFPSSDVIYACRTDSSLQSKMVNVNNVTNEDKVFALLENYPNPFNSSTVIKISLSSNNHVRLDLFDVSGKFIASLIDKRLNAGVTEIELNTDKYRLSSGVYFIKMTSQKGFTKIKKIISLK